MFKQLVRLLTGRSETRTVTVVDASASRQEQTSDAKIHGRSVMIYRPPVMLNRAGEAMPGISKDLIANYLVSMTGALAEADLGAVSLEWAEQQGRFATTRMTIHAWEQEVEMLHPIAPISAELMDAMEVYRNGIVLMVRELHKGQQQYQAANLMLTQALDKVRQLRDAPYPHFNDAEFLFITAGVSRALTMSAFVPDSENREQVNVFEDEVRYQPAGEF